MGGADVNFGVHYKTALPLNAFDQPILVQPGQNRTNQGSADVEVLHQFGFRGELFSDSPNTGVDIFPQFRFDPATLGCTFQICTHSSTITSLF